MQPIRVSENVVSVSAFKPRAAEWLRRISESNEPVVITQHGKTAGVLISPVAFDELTEQLRFVRAVEQGLADVKAGRLSPHKKVVAELRRRFEKNKKQ